MFQESEKHISEDAENDLTPQPVTDLAPPSSDSVPINNPYTATKASTALPRKKRRLNPEQNDNDAMLQEAFKILKDCTGSQSTDPYFTFGQHIANELRKYDQRTLAHVKQAINNIIFEADMGKYNYGSYTTTSPYSTTTPSPVQFQTQPQTTTTFATCSDHLSSDRGTEDGNNVFY